jgi:5-deoxy-D-glucuronate isomerase
MGGDVEEDTSKLEVVLLEEQERSFRITAVNESEVSTLPKGYVRESGRNGYAYYYPRRREGGRVEG